MMQHNESIALKAFTEASDTDVLKDAIYEAYTQNPLIGLVGSYKYNYASMVLTVEYKLTKDEQKTMQAEVLQEVKRVLPTIIKADMADIEKEEAINAYLCSTAEYDMEALQNAEENNFKSVDSRFNNAFTPYGVLINKVGVCASYAGAFKLLADAAELDAVVVTGDLNGNLPHAWNRIKIEDQWMTIDTTNNDNASLPMFCSTYLIE